MAVTISTILQYVLETPYNVNPAILKQFLRELTGTDGAEAAEEIGKPAPQETSYLGKNASDLMGPDIKVLENGSVTGTLHYVTEFTEFDAGNPENQKGYFFYIKLGEKYTGKTIKVQRTSGTPGTLKTSTDTDWVLKLTDGASTVYSITVTDDSVPPLTLRFNTATFEPEQ